MVSFLNFYSMIRNAPYYPTPARGFVYIYLKSLNSVIMEAIPLYTSVSCNRTPAAADWSTGSNLIAFGACNSVAIFNPQVCRVLKT